MKNKCHACRGLCCTYVTVDLAAPKNWDDFDEIRWYILHKNVVVYKTQDEEEWRVEFIADCDYLDRANHRCTQYENRPDVCKEYTTEECDGVDELNPEGCEVFLQTEHDLKEYLKTHKPEFVPLVFKN